MLDRSPGRSGGSRPAGAGRRGATRGLSRERRLRRLGRKSAVDSGATRPTPSAFQAVGDLGRSQRQVSVTRRDPPGAAAADCVVAGGRRPLAQQSSQPTWTSCSSSRPPVDDLESFRLGGITAMVASQGDAGRGREQGRRGRRRSSRRRPQSDLFPTSSTKRSVAGRSGAIRISLQPQDVALVGSSGVEVRSSTG